VWGVVTFYTMYNRAPVGKHLIQVCTSISCHLNGAEEVFHECKQRLGRLKTGELSKEGKDHGTGGRGPRPGDQARAVWGNTEGGGSVCERAAGTNAFPEFEIGNTNEYLVGSPASAPGIISVGAFVSRRMWPALSGPIQYSGLTDADIGKIAGFSSPGPLRTDELAPTISAPGMGIASTRSAVALLDANFNINDGKHTINQGTSQAAPHVAGVVALIFERYPHETTANIRNRLILSATHDEATGDIANNVYGYGKLNAVGAMTFDTPVFLSTFEALPTEGGVALRWLVDGDAPFVGFHLSRA